MRLEWESKPTEIERLSLPFQTVERINESRATRERDSGSLFAARSGDDGIRNQLIWGDNKLVMSSLLAEFAGQVRLIYIDPPFDTGTDFSFRVGVGDGTLTKSPSVLEEHAYRDTWSRGRASYLRVMYERLVLIHELLTADGSLYLHCAPNVSHYLKVLCDEIFGGENFRAEIAWKRVSGHGDARKWSPVHEVILHYSKGASFVWNPPREPLDERYISDKYNRDDGDGRGPYQLDNLTSPNPRPNMTYEWEGFAPPAKGWRYSLATMTELDADGRIYKPSDKTKRPRLKRYLEESEGHLVDDVWDDIPPVNSQAVERTGYETQKPLALLERIIEASSDAGDLVADVFCGSGTTLVAAEQLGRRWIGCDLGRFAVHTTRKRILRIPDSRPFDIKNLGMYERQRWQVATGNGALRAYLDTILAFYRAEPIEGFAHLHGRKAGRMVHVGATDAPVTIDETEDVMDEMADNGIEACDLLGWEWEMGLHDTITETARRRGLDLRPRQIPREVMERQVADADAVRFFELAHVDLDIRRQGSEVSVVLTDFLIPSEELIPPNVRDQISSWTDLIDYWSVDFDFSDEVFDNQWQAYRSRDEPTLATQSDWHEYPGPGRYAIVVKIIDIFGNDTTKLAEVRIK
ncbi:MAG: site-specific DNA-methyltransferase [Solirubrobacteraceae bacterium]